LGQGKHSAHITCEACGNATKPDTVYVTMWHNGQLVVIEDVPAQICEACHEQYYDEATRAAITRLAENAFPKRRIVREMTVPVYSLEDTSAGGLREPTEVAEDR
jgi:YgiT-type zinc finger domain-containing protein